MVYTGEQSAYIYVYSTYKNAHTKSYFQTNLHQLKEAAHKNVECATMSMILPVRLTDLVDRRMTFLSNDFTNKTDTVIDSVKWLFWCSLFLSGHYSSNAPLSPHFIYSFMVFLFVFWISSNINDFIIYGHFFMYSYHMGTGDYCRPQIFTKITIKQQQQKTLKQKKQKHKK